MVLNSYNKRKKGGFLVLTMVLLVCAVVLIVATGMLFRSIGEVNQTADSERSLQAWSTVNACAEYALAQIATRTGWTDYTGGVSLDVGDKTCYIYPVENGTAGSKIINASSTVSGFTKKVSIEVATNTPRVKINSWEEVADF
jgi:type II secretory pathway pseudopilin PulG